MSLDGGRTHEVREDFSNSVIVGQHPYRRLDDSGLGCIRTLSCAFCLAEDDSRGGLRSELRSLGYSVAHRISVA